MTVFRYGSVFSAVWVFDVRNFESGHVIQFLIQSQRGFVSSAVFYLSFPVIPAKEGDGSKGGPDLFSSSSFLPRDGRFRISGASAFESDVGAVVGLPDDRSFRKSRLYPVFRHRRLVAWKSQFFLSYRQPLFLSSIIILTVEIQADGGVAFAQFVFGRDFIFSGVFHRHVLNF